MSNSVQSVLPVTHPPRLSVRGTFASLRHPNYRLWFIGQLVSLVGTWMQSTALGYLIYELTQSSVYLGIAGFATGLPAWLFTLYGGLVADRVSRRTMLTLTQLAMLILAVILATLTFTRIIQPWHIILLAFLLGIANSFDAPARLAFTLEMVPREDLTNAVALNSTMFNLATAVGPFVAGFTYALFGPAWCFTINAVSFIAVIIALMLMRLKPVPRSPIQGSAFAEIYKGFAFVAKNRIVRTLVIYLAIVSLFGMGFATLMPAWAVKVLSGDATTNGFLQSARGVGAVIGALVTAALARQGLRGRLITIGSWLFPIMLFIFALVQWLPVSLLVLVGLGWSLMTYMNNSNSLVQTQVPDELRGRVLGIYSLSFFGLMPVGALLAGALANQLSEPTAVMIGAAVLLVTAGVTWFQVPELRQIT